MAIKKNKNTLSYLQMPLPQGGKYSKMTKVAFGGLNKRYTIDSGNLSMESNISTSEYPYLTPSNKKEDIFKDTEIKYKNALSMSAFDKFLVIIYYKNSKIMIDYITDDGEIHTGIVNSNEESIEANGDISRSIIQFNVYDTPTDPLTGKFVKKLLIFPDKASMFMRIVEKPDNFNVDTADTDVMYFHYNNDKKIYSYIKVDKNTDSNGMVTFTRELKQSGSENCFVCDSMEALVKTYSNGTKDEETGLYPPPDTASHNYYYENTHKNAINDNAFIYRWVDDESDSENSGWKISIPPSMPNLKYATVHLSRVFGVDDDRVYASGYNDYTNWNLDTIDEYNEANSWCSPSQSNTKAGGNFTGITTFQNHVICFKHDFMHEIYNTKNPFRLQDIYAEGTIDNRTIQDVDGKLIFVSEDDVKVYTGSNPRVIGFNLNMPKYTYAVSGTDNRNYYLYCENGKSKKYLYVYDTFTDLWSEQIIENRVLSFAHNKNGMYMLCEDSNFNAYIYKMDTDDYSHIWSFETDLITNKTVNIKHIKKLQMLVDIAKNAKIQVYILYDDEVFDENTKAKRLVYESTKTGKIPIRVKPRNTANYGFKLHVEGEGYVKLYELEIFVEAGGDMYV